VSRGRRGLRDAGAVNAGTDDRDVDVNRAAHAPRRAERIASLISRTAMVSM
jgi:hypothetical protein